MLGAIARRLFGSVNDRIIKSLRSHVDAINALESKMQLLTDEGLREQTGLFRARLAAGETLDDIMVESFAVVREAAKRVLGQRHYDVQLIGGMLLHKGMISEMRTGEGKTLVATLPVYLNALSGKGVHVVTVNDYLAKRDAEWMGRVYKFLGLTVGCIVHGLSDFERAEAYNCDVTNGTNNEFGFDYLRDNMKYSHEQLCQRPFNFAIVDEVDSILIDEARTPLIISGPTEDNSQLYYQIDRLIPKLDESDFEKDEKSKTVTLTEEGILKVEEILKKEGLLLQEQGLYDIENVALVHHINQALRAHKLFSRDVDYIVKDNKVIIIDEFTGRMMEGRRYSEGLHQALEAKEKVAVQNENQTLASITFQNYFRIYPKLAGMTGSGMTEANEFRDIYKLEVVEVPTHLTVRRIDEDDEIYRTATEKYEAIIKQIIECYNVGQPVLVGTVSIEKSEFLSSLLKKRNIPHQVLNARYHEQEAFVIAQAGRFKAVTIATNMAGRGTDIMLGGNPDMLLAQQITPEMNEEQIAKIKQQVLKQIQEEKQKVIEAGGLFVIGTERHESRRIDNQLRGRSGRQGDPGKTKFYLSLEDDLMRIFASDRISGVLQKLGLKEGEAIFHPMISRALERAQQKVEGFNYEIRKNLLKYDDVMNDQRKIIYEQRLDIMQAESVADVLEDMYIQVNTGLVTSHIPPQAFHEDWDIEGLAKELYHVYGIHFAIKEWAKEDIADQEILERINKLVAEHFAAKEQQFGTEVMRMAEKRFLLLTLDQLWKEHLHSLDHLRQGINLRAYGQKDPLNEYKREAFMMFQAMLNELRTLYVGRLAHSEVNVSQPLKGSLLDENYAPKIRMQESRVDPAELYNADQQESAAIIPIRHSVAEQDRDPANPATWGKIGRNEPCPCGSGMKHKHCHGQLD